jgi:hypothetical protein
MHLPCLLRGSCERAWRTEHPGLPDEFTLWDPGRGWAPRGFCGATASPSTVELVLVAGEPSRPDEDERYDVEDSVDAAAKHSLQSMIEPRTPTHRGMRKILSLLFSGRANREGVDRVFRMESTFCSIPKPLKEGSNVPEAVERSCGDNYVLPLLQVFPNSLVVVAGRNSDPRKRKAQERIRRLIETRDSSLAARAIYVHHPYFWALRYAQAVEICRAELRREDLRADLPLLQRVRRRLLS